MTALQRDKPIMRAQMQTKTRARQHFERRFRLAAASISRSFLAQPHGSMRALSVAHHLAPCFRNVRLLCHLHPPLLPRLSHFEWHRNDNLVSERFLTLSCCQEGLLLHSLGRNQK